MHAEKARALFPAGQNWSVADGVFDRLADVMLDADDVLSIVSTEDADGLLQSDAVRFSWIVPIIRRIYDDVNELMKRLD